MVTTKVIVLALVGLFALQVSGHRIQTVNGLNDVIEIAVKVLHKVTEIIDKAVKVSTDIINTIVKDLILIHDNAAEYTKTIIDLELKVLNKLIDEVKDNTDGIAEKILQCVEDVETDLNNLEALALEEAATCTDGLISVVLQNAEQILADFDKIDPQIDAQADALQKCEKKLIPIDCIKDVIKNLIDIVTKVPVDLKDDVAKIQADWKNLERVVKKCSADVLPDLKRLANILENDFLKCIG